MIQNSPNEALGRDAADARELLVDVVRSRHERAAEAHEAAATRYTIGFGGQWRDLLEDTVDAFSDRGFQPHRLSPAGYRLPIVNGCLIYVWRVPGAPDAPGKFATSKTRMNSFFEQEPLPLFGSSFVEGGDDIRNESERDDFERALRAVNKAMPVVLVMVQSTPERLFSIDWALAEYVDGIVRLHGDERIWTAMSSAGEVAVDVESFDSGEPVVPSIELQKQSRPSDA